MTEEAKETIDTSELPFQLRLLLSNIYSAERQYNYNLSKNEIDLITYLNIRLYERYKHLIVNVSRSSNFDLVSEPLSGVDDYKKSKNFNSRENVHVPRIFAGDIDSYVISDFERIFRNVSKVMDKFIDGRKIIPYELLNTDRSLGDGVIFKSKIIFLD